MAQWGAKKTLRQLREERGWSRLDVAVRLGVHLTMIYRWERGLRVPPAQRLNSLARLFGVSVREIALEPAEQAPPEPHQRGMG